MSRILKQLKILGLVLILGATLQSNSEAVFANEQSNVGGDFTLTDHNGEKFELQQLRGKLVLIFFGYTFCPDICPTELSSLAKILRSLGDDADKVSTLFISVDPERDTPDKLKNYVPFFSPKLIGLTGSVKEISAVANAYKVQTKIHSKIKGNEYYLVDHSANLYVLGSDGKIITMIPFGLPADHILQVVKNEINKLH